MADEIEDQPVTSSGDVRPTLAMAVALGAVVAGALALVGSALLPAYDLSRVGGVGPGSRSLARLVPGRYVPMVLAGPALLLLGGVVRLCRPRARWTLATLLAGLGLAVWWAGPALATILFSDRTIMGSGTLVAGVAGGLAIVTAIGFGVELVAGAGRLEPGPLDAAEAVGVVAGLGLLLCSWFSGAYVARTQDGRTFGHAWGRLLGNGGAGSAVGLRTQVAIYALPILVVLGALAILLVRRAGRGTPAPVRTMVWLAIAAAAAIQQVVRVVAVEGISEGPVDGAIRVGAPAFTMHVTVLGVATLLGAAVAFVGAAWSSSTPGTTGAERLDPDPADEPERVGAAPA